MKKLLLLAKYFFPRLEEWVMGAVPTGFAYEGPLKDNLHLEGRWLWTALAVLIVAFALILSANRVHKRRKALSEVLATGYHISFVDKLDRQFPAMPNVNVQGQAVPVAHAALTLPRSAEELRGFLRRMADHKAAGKWVDALYGERTVLVELNAGRATIIDYPRTLNSLSEYLDQDGDTNAHGDVPRRYYKWFTQRLMTARKKRPDLYQRIHYLDFAGARIA